MRRLKLIGLFMAFVLVFTMFAGCGGNKGITSTNTPGSTAQTSAGTTQTPGGNETLPDMQEIWPGKLIPTAFTGNIDKAKIIADHTDKDGKTFVTVALTDDPQSLCAYGPGSSKIRSQLLDMIYEPLFRYDTLGGSLEPIVGKSYKEVEPGVWEITLNQGVVDTNGNPIKAQDVKFSMWDIGVVKYSTSKIKSYTTEVEVIDDYTLRLHLNIPGSITFSTVMTVTYVFSQKSYEESADGMVTTPVGSGAYKLASWDSGSKIVLDKNENYWAKDNRKTCYQQANVDRIINVVIKDAAQRIIALETGAIDLLSSVDPTDLPKFSDTNKYSQSFSVAAQRETLFMNCSDASDLGDLRIRQAVLYAIDNNAVMELASGGDGRLCYSLPDYRLADYLPEFENEDYYNYNPEKAKQLIAEAGKKPADIKITIMTENTPAINVTIAQIIQAQLSEIGITNVELKPVDGALFSQYKTDKTSSDIIIAAAGGPYDSVLPTYTFVDYQMTSETSGLMHIVNDEWQALQAEALSCKDSEKAKYVRLLHNYIKDNAYGYALYQPYLYCIVTPVITEYTLNVKCYDLPGCYKYLWNE